MTDINPVQSVLPFKPKSLHDFNRYAKNLAWLIREPYQKSQDLLAKIYGYSGFHELKRTLTELPDRGSGDIPS